MGVRAVVNALSPSALFEFGWLSDRYVNRQSSPLLADDKSEEIAIKPTCRHGSFQAYTAGRSVAEFGELFESVSFLIRRQARQLVKVKVGSWYDHRDSG
jgi:hypothetical protein